jgi:ABC-type glycerol-3-phosphate transport system permease component
MAKNKQLFSFSDRAFHAINNLYLFLCLIIVLFPLLNVVSQSFRSPASVISGKVLFWPVDFSLEGYKNIITNKDLLNGFLNSFIYTGLGTLVSLVLTLTGAYPLARKGLVGKKLFTWILTFTMIFNGGLIPTYLLVRSMNMLDTVWAMVIPNAVAVWNLLIARAFFENTIPDGLYEAAELDGCNDFTVFTTIVVPLSKPIIAVLVLFYAVGIWNNYFDGLIYLSQGEKFPLQLVLRNILIQTQMATFMKAGSGQDQSQMMALSELMKYSIIVFSSLPVMLLYPFIQKYFVKGIMIGSVKG